MYEDEDDKVILNSVVYNAITHLHYLTPNNLVSGWRSLKLYMQEVRNENWTDLDKIDFFKIDFQIIDNQYSSSGES